VKLIYLSSVVGILCYSLQGCLDFNFWQQWLCVVSRLVCNIKAVYCSIFLSVAESEPPGADLFGAGAG